MANLKLQGVLEFSELTCNAGGQRRKLQLKLGERSPLLHTTDGGNGVSVAVHPIADLDPMLSQDLYRELSEWDLFGVALASADAAMMVGLMLVLQNEVDCLPRANRARQLHVDNIVREYLELENEQNCVKIALEDSRDPTF